jgi:mRNA interferase RelE/StbE
MYSVELKSQPQRYIRAQPKNIQKRLLNKIENLRSDPYPAGCAQLHADPNLQRIRTGDYRIIYHVQTDLNHIVITKVGHRKDVYKSF